jgi:hypothetical protein
MKKGLQRISQPSGGFVLAPSENTLSYDTPEGYRFGYWVNKDHAGNDD